MATVSEIEYVILRVAGDPVSGVVKQLAPIWAEEIAKLDQPQKRSKRVVEPKETR